jgi:hypothetical protein
MLSSIYPRFVRCQHHESSYTCTYERPAVTDSTPALKFRMSHPNWEIMNEAPRFIILTT